jgi:enamine deaminase RidA (YjgF/YER057c/UK114 family)
MRSTIVSWLARELVVISGESRPGMAVDEATRELLERFGAVLRAEALSPADVVRTRLFTRDAASRGRASAVRNEVLGPAGRAASASFVAAERFESDGLIALDLLALRPAAAGRGKVVVEYEPTRSPARYASVDGLVFLSGVTSPQTTLAEQVTDTLARIEESLVQAGTSWQRVKLVSCFLQREARRSTLQELLRDLPASIPQIEIERVEGYSTDGRLIEIEVTALV